MATIRLLKGDCLQKLKELEDNSIDSVVTDPPYEIGFMGKGWDDSGIANNPELWKEVLRVLKPGGHILSFAGSRTYHRMAVRIEDAGFEIRDQIMWIYGSGFPKSHNIGKAVDKIEGNEREVVGEEIGTYKLDNAIKNANTLGKMNQKLTDDGYEIKTITKGNSDWEGWGTALKPAHEPIVMARKPFKGTVADNVLEWGTGGINVDGCRIGYEDTPNPATNPKYRHEQNYKMPEKGQESKGAVSFSSSNNDVNTEGRFPANIIFDEEAGKILDKQSGKLNKQGKC
jgi:site-specific DNA-methyltransferase (adenine-specific)